MNFQMDLGLDPTPEEKERLDRLVNEIFMVEGQLIRECGVDAYNLFKIHKQISEAAKEPAPMGQILLSLSRFNNQPKKDLH